MTCLIDSLNPPTDPTAGSRGITLGGALQVNLKLITDSY